MSALALAANLYTLGGEGGLPSTVAGGVRDKDFPKAVAHRVDSAPAQGRETPLRNVGGLGTGFLPSLPKLWTDFTSLGRRWTARFARLPPLSQSTGVGARVDPRSSAAAGGGSGVRINVGGGSECPPAPHSQRCLAAEKKAPKVPFSPHSGPSLGLLPPSGAGGGGSDSPVQKLQGPITAPTLGLPRVSFCFALPVFLSILDASGLIHLIFSHLQNGFCNILPKELETRVLLALSGGHHVGWLKLGSSWMAFRYLWVYGHLLEASPGRGCVQRLGILGPGEGEPSAVLAADTASTHLPLRPDPANAPGGATFRCVCPTSSPAQSVNMCILNVILNCGPKF